MLIVDNYVDYEWSYFLKEKIELLEKVNEIIKELKKKYNIHIKNIQYDNAGEIFAVEALHKKDENCIMF